jgi:hypothetical protein
MYGRRRRHRSAAQEFRQIRYAGVKDGKQANEEEDLMQITTFKEMYIAELQELMSLEGQLGQALLRMAEVVSHPSFIDASSRGNAASTKTPRIHAAKARRRPAGAHGSGDAGSAE